MGKLIHSPYLYAPVDVQVDARNWREASDGASFVRQGNRASPVRGLADATNRLAGRYPRPWFWMAQPILSSTTVQADQVGSNPLYLTKVYDGVYNARSWTGRYVVIPRETGSGDAYASSYTFPTTKTPYSITTLTPLELCDSVTQTEMSHSRGLYSMTELEMGLSTWQGLTVLDVVFHDDQLKTLDTDLHLAAQGDLAKPGGSVLADIGEQIRACFANLRMQNLPIVLQWHAQRPSAGWATPLSTDRTAIRVSGTSWTNLLDTSAAIAALPHFRYARSSPGVLVPAYLSGRGTTLKAGGQSVKVTFRVLARAETQDCTVRFQGPDHVASNWCDLTWTAGAEPSWRGTGATYVSLNTLAMDSGVSSQRNKIDQFGRANTAGGVLYVYALVAWILWS